MNLYIFIVFIFLDFYFNKYVLKSSCRVLNYKVFLNRGFFLIEY